MTRIRLTLLVALIAVVGFSASTPAQETSKQEPPARTRVKPKPSVEPVEKIADTSQPSEAELAMQRALTSLSNQIGLLNDEVRKLRVQTERNSQVMELLLNEDRLAKLEEKIQEAADHKAQLDAREQELLRRSKNIPNELVLRGGLRRDEAEAAIRADLQRALEDVHNQQAAYQQRSAEMVEQATRLRTRVETLRRKVDSAEEKNPQQN
jgi:predicted  nucleic acid-binding Zn-ribbon protein